MALVRRDGTSFDSSDGAIRPACPSCSPHGCAASEVASLSGHMHEEESGDGLSHLMLNGTVNSYFGQGLRQIIDTDARDSSEVDASSGGPINRVIVP